VEAVRRAGVGGGEGHRGRLAEAHR
jgi:hypothetical protein